MNNKKRYNPQFKIGDLVTFVPYEEKRETVLMVEALY